MPYLRNERLLCEATHLFSNEYSLKDAGTLVSIASASVLQILMQHTHTHTHTYIQND